MVWLSSYSKCTSGKSVLKMKGEHVMSDSDDDRPYLHVKHLRPGSTDQTVKRKGQRKSVQGKCTTVREGKCPGVNQKHFYLTLLVASIALNITLGVYLFYKTEGIRDTSTPSVNDVGGLSTCVCVLCTSLGLSVDNGRPHIPDTMDVIWINNSKMCCIKNSEHLQKMITLFSAQYTSYDGLSSETEKTGSPSLDQNQYGAHLFLDSIALKDNRLVWTDEYGLGSAYVGTGIEFGNGSFRIKQEGCYFVYSFITFKSRETVSENVNLVHTVSRYDPKLPKLKNQLLLIRKQSLAKESERFNTSYLGASLVLRVGDELSVNVNHIWTIYGFAPSNYFGIFRIQC